jgi:transcriptional regulator with XRE-family HTH domain
MHFVSDSKQSENSETDGNSGADDSHVGSFIREQRERANLSLRRLADRAGVSNPYLSQIERGIRRPSAEILKRISRALEVSAESLYTRAGLIDEGTATPTVIESIDADTALSPRQKKVLLDLYRALLDAAAAGEPQEDTKENTP